MSAHAQTRPVLADGPPKYHLDRSGALAPPWRTQTGRMRRQSGRTTRGGARGSNAAK